MSSEQIEDVMSAISEMGVNIVENDEEGAEEQPVDDSDAVDDGSEQLNISPEKKKETMDRTDDPGPHVPARDGRGRAAQSREGEIAIAKRIEAGREAMIAGPVRKPADLPGDHHLARRTQRWRDQLREIIDLEATYAGPDAKPVRTAGDGEISEKPPRPQLQGRGRAAGNRPRSRDDEDRRAVPERSHPSGPRKMTRRTNTLSLARWKPS
jgi:RNA polymerase primary sigma factor